MEKLKNVLTNVKFLTIVCIILSVLTVLFTIQSVLAGIENNNIKEQLEEHDISESTEETVNSELSAMIAKRNNLQKELDSYDNDNTKEDIEVFLKRFCEEGLSYQLSADFSKAQQELQKHTEKFFTTECYQKTHYYQDIQATEGTRVVKHTDSMFLEYQGQQYFIDRNESIIFESVCFEKCELDYAEVILLAEDANDNYSNVIYLLKLCKEEDDWKISSIDVIKR